VELIAEELRVLNTATTPPFPIEDDAEIDEAVRLRQRIHDLRRPVMQQRLRVRHELYQSVRAACTALGLYEVETPMLARSTPEGARDFLVPSRIYHGSFYALPQSPQIFKQLLMIAGYDRYSQIARCFRDEDQRADRQLEFTQIDLELSFVGVDEVLQVLEEITVRAFRDVIGVELPRPFPRLSYADVMARYGSDKPDTRIRLEIVDLSDLVADSDFRVFVDAVRGGGVVRALPIPDARGLSRSELDRVVERSRDWGAQGLAWVRVTDDGGWQSPIAKYLSSAEQSAIGERAGLRPGHLVFFVADRVGVACEVLGRLRLELGARLERYDERAWDPFFVIDFPLFETDPHGHLAPMHMPFVAPMEEDLELLDSDPQRVRSTHYDLVLNGVELGSGSLRNHRSDVQLRILDSLGYSEADSRQRFGFLLDALDAGAPPHGGFAFGFDRLCQLLAGGESLRDVLAFPKTQRAQDLFAKSPSPVDAEQLLELGLRLRREPADEGG
jgi:aspartyl-tRNA synthetase